MKKVFLSNHYDEKLKRGMDEFDEKYLEPGDYLYGKPRSTEKYTTEELELIGVFGIYRAVDDEKD